MKLIALSNFSNFKAIQVSNEKVLLKYYICVHQKSLIFVRK